MSGYNYPQGFGWVTCLDASRSVPVQKGLRDILAPSLAPWQQRAGSQAWSFGRGGRQMLLPINGSIKFLDCVLRANLLPLCTDQPEHEQQTQTSWVWQGDISFKIHLHLLAPSEWGQLYFCCFCPSTAAMSYFNTRVIQPDGDSTKTFTFVRSNLSEGLSFIHIKYKNTAVTAVYAGKFLLYEHWNATKGRAKTDI